METGRQKLKDESDFYRDLDQSHNRSSSGCQVLITIFLLLFILTTFMSYYAITRLQQFHPISQLRKQLPFQKKQPDKADTVTLYESDIQSRLSGSLGAVIPLKNKKLTITPDGLILEGLSATASKKLIFTADPVVRNQKIALENIRLKNNSSGLQGQFSDLIYTQIGQGLALCLNNLVAFHVSDIQLKTGEMILTVY